jgi:hypothetical protein
MKIRGCSPGVTPGHTYSLRARYASTAVTRYALYDRSGPGTWTYWISSPGFAPGSTYIQTVFGTPPVPAGATGISFGLNLFTNGTLTTDDYAIYDTVGAPPVGRGSSSGQPVLRSRPQDAATGLRTHLRGRVPRMALWFSGDSRIHYRVAGAGFTCLAKRRSRRELLTTRTELAAIAAPAIIGFSRPAAATGMPMAL